MNIDEIISSARRPESTVQLCLRGDLQAVWENLDREFDQADRELTDDVLAGGSPAASAKIAQQMEEVRREMQASMVTFTLRAVGRIEWQGLVSQNPPREGVDDGDVNEESFVTGMIAACCVEPKMTLEQAAKFRDSVTDGQWQELANCAWALNKNMMTVPFSLSASTRLALAAVKH
jgi:hypothetical protein